MIGIKKRKKKVQIHVIYQKGKTQEINALHKNQLS